MMELQKGMEKNMLFIIQFLMNPIMIYLIIQNLFCIQKIQQVSTPSLGSISFDFINFQGIKKSTPLERILINEPDPDGSNLIIFNIKAKAKSLSNFKILLEEGSTNKYKEPSNDDLIGTKLNDKVNYYQYFINNITKTIPKGKYSPDDICNVLSKSFQEINN